MKKYGRYLIFAAAALAVCCGKPSEGNLREEDGNQEVQGPGMVLALNTVSGDILPGRTWAEGDNTCVFHSPAGRNEYKPDGLFEFDGGGNKFSGTLGFIPEEGTSYDWRIVCPGNLSPAGTVSLEIGRESAVQSFLGSTGHLCGEEYPLYGGCTSEALLDSPVRADILPLYAIIELDVRNVTTGPVTMQSASLTSSEKICGSFDVSFAGSEITFSPGKECRNTSTVSLVSQETLRAGKSAGFFFAVRPFSAPAGSLKFDVNGVEYTCPDAVEFASGRITTIEMPYDRAEEDPDALKGIFTVSASGKKVVFSRGNLWYGHEASNRQFRIAASQNETLTPESDWDGASFNGNYIQHFIWSDNRYDAYAIVAKDVTWKTTDRLFAADDGAVDGWTVLSRDEWDYLLNERTVNGGKGEGHSYFNSGIKNGGYKADGKAIKGLFIFPDDYAGTPAVKENKTLSWETINEAGIAYLPAAGGYSKRTTETDKGWVSTADFTGNYLGADIFVNGSGTNTFCTVKFNQNSPAASIVTTPNPKYGYTIRLVREIN